MQKSYTKSPAWCPSREWLEISKNICGRMSPVLRNGQSTDYDGDQTCKSPEDGECLRHRFISHLVHTVHEVRMRSYIKLGEMAIAQG